MCCERLRPWPLSRRSGIGVGVAASNAPFGLLPCPEGAPDLVSAASLLLAILRTCKARSWTDLTEIPERVVLTDEQLDLLNAHREVLAFVRYGIGQTVTVSACDTCGRWGLVGAHAPEKCWLTFGCPGTAKRASAAKRRDLEPQPEPSPPPVLALVPEPDDEAPGWLLDDWTP